MIAFKGQKVSGNAGPLRSMARQQRGASLVEYGLLAGLIAVVAIGAVSTVGDTVEGIFTDANDEIALARLIASADRVHYLPGGTPFPAQECYFGTPGNDTVPASGAPGDTQDCFDGLSGNDTFAIAGTPARDILAYLGPDAQVFRLPAGNHWVVGPQVHTGTTTLSAGTGESLIDLRPFSVADLEFKASSSTDLEIALPANGEIMLEDQFPDERFARFITADGEMTAPEVRSYAISSQATEGSDDINGTAMDDVIRPLGGADNILPFEGDDTIVYASGNDTIFGDQNTGFDRLDMRKYARAQVSFSTDWGGSAVRITTPDGFVRLTQQMSNPVGSDAANIEEVIFSDVTMTDAQIRAATSASF